MDIKQLVPELVTVLTSIVDCVRYGTHARIKWPAHKVDSWTPEQMKISNSTVIV